MDGDPEQAIEHDAEELAERVERLGEHIEESKERLGERAAEAQRLGEGQDVAGEWSGSDDQAGGEDPLGAHEERDEPSDEDRHGR